jgi:hypothetical protein
MQMSGVKMEVMQVIFSEDHLSANVRNGLHQPMSTIPAEMLVEITDLRLSVEYQLHRFLI